MIPPLPLLQGGPESEAPAWARWLNARCERWRAEWTAPLSRRERWSLPLLAVLFVAGLAWAVPIWGRVIGGGLPRDTPGVLSGALLRVSGLLP